MDPPPGGAIGRHRDPVHARRGGLHDPVHGEIHRLRGRDYGRPPFAGRAYPRGQGGRSEARGGGRPGRSSRVQLSHARLQRGRDGDDQELGGRQRRPSGLQRGGSDCEGKTRGLG